MEPRQPGASWGWILITVNAVVLASIVGSNAQDWFPDINPLLVSVITGVITGVLAGLAVGAILLIARALRRRRRP